MANPQVQQIYQMLAASPVADATQTIEEMRRNYDAFTSMYPPLPGIDRESAPTGGVPAEWLRPAGADPDRAVLFVHGGGFMFGSLASHRDPASRIAKAANAAVLSIEYRLAPEHAVPAAVEDAVHAFRWLVDEAGFAPEKIGISGESAGGGLALATALALRDAGHPLPGAIALMSPWVDMVCDSASLDANDDPVMVPAIVRMMAQAYLRGQDPKTPLASPLHADLRGLPRLLVQVGAAEKLHDEGKQLADRAREAGVDVEFEAWEDMFHAWHLFAIMLEDGQRALDRVGAFLRG